MQTVFLVAKVLSAVTLLAFLAALVNLWRRPSVPPFSYGAITLSQRRLKGLWFAFLFGGLVVGSSNDPLVQHTEDRGEPLPASTEAPPNTTYFGVDIPLPFYRYERNARSVKGKVIEEHIVEGVVLPWSFLWALLAYYVLVVRWNPDSRWARRILEGRKAWKRSDDNGDENAAGQGSG
jgi:hypothetical protein